MFCGFLLLSDMNSAFFVKDDPLIVNKEISQLKKNLQRRTKYAPWFIAPNDWYRVMLENTKDKVLLLISLFLIKILNLLG